jgi:hypothetical protein
VECPLFCVQITALNSSSGRCANGSARVEVKPHFIELVSPWENGYIESFNDKMRDELLDREILYALE